MRKKPRCPIWGRCEGKAIQRLLPQRFLSIDDPRQAYIDKYCDGIFRECAYYQWVCAREAMLYAA